MPTAELRTRKRIPVLASTNKKRKSTKKRVSHTVKKEYQAPASRREKIMLRDGKCVRCGSVEALTLDHIRPRCLGGSNLESNLQVLCASCNCRVKSGEESRLYQSLMMLYAPHRVSWSDRGKEEEC